MYMNRELRLSLGIMEKQVRVLAFFIGYVTIISWEEL